VAGQKEDASDESLAFEPMEDLKPTGSAATEVNVHEGERAAKHFLTSMFEIG
jgi:hypothetical protein